MEETDYFGQNEAVMTCSICSGPMEWEDCWNGCDDGYLDMYDDDPLWYDEDDVEVCGACRGAGGWWVCPRASEHAKERHE